MTVPYHGQLAPTFLWQMFCDTPQRTTLEDIKKKTEGICRYFLPILMTTTSEVVRKNIYVPNFNSHIIFVGWKCTYKLLLFIYQFLLFLGFWRVSWGGTLGGIFPHNALQNLNSLQLKYNFIPKRTRQLYMSKNLNVRMGEQITYSPTAQFLLQKNVFMKLYPR